MARFLVVTTLTLIVCVSPAFAQSTISQSNVSIAPPPLGTPRYDGALLDQRADAGAPGSDSLDLGLAYVNVSGDNLSLNGYGVMLAYRWVLGPFGVRIPVTLGALSGDSLGTDVSGFAFDSTVLVDANVVAFDRASLQVFAGYGLLGSRSSADFLGSGSARTEVTVFTLLYGPQLGAQAALEVGAGFVVTPFAMIQSISGRTDQDIDTPGFTGFLDTIDFPRITVRRFGLDVEYRPLGLSLSGITQLTQDDPAIERIDTFSLVLSYRIGRGAVGEVSAPSPSDAADGQF